jgi:uncharacterized protein (TIGR03437 family)
MNLFPPAISVLILALLCLLSAPVAPRGVGLAATAPLQSNEEELRVDDGTPEGTPVGSVPNLIIVNRLTPSRYPATLKTIRIFFRQTNPTPAGTQIRLLAFARPFSNASTPTNVAFLVDQRVTIPALSTAGQFVDFAIQNGPTITAGDFFVGFQQPNTANVPYFWYDSNEPLQSRAFASMDGGVRFLSEVRTEPNGPIHNFMIRAVVATVNLAGLAAVSAASFAGGELAPEALAAAFGNGLATGTTVAVTQPLPLTLGGVSVRVRSSDNVERPAPLFFVSPAQINFQVPPGTNNGPAAITVLNGETPVALGTVAIANLAPGVFAANSNGQGVAAAVALRVRANGQQSFEAVARFDEAQRRFFSVPLDLGPADEQVFLILFGTGLRFRENAPVTARLGGVEAQVTFAGAQGQLIGVEQINALIPRSLAGRGEIEVVLAVGGKTANTVQVNIR